MVAYLLSSTKLPQTKYGEYMNCRYRCVIVLCVVALVTLSGCCFRGRSVNSVTLPHKVERPEDVSGVVADGRWSLSTEQSKRLGRYIRQLEAERDALRAHPFFGGDDE